MLDCFAEIIKDLIPSKDLATPVWIARLLVLFGMGSVVAIAGYYGLRETALGERVGIRPITAPVLSKYEFVQLQESIYDIFHQAHEEGGVDGLYLFLGYDDNTGEFAYLDSTNTVTLTVAFPAALLSSVERKDDIFQSNRPDYQKRMVSDRGCFTTKLSVVNQKRLRLLISGSRSDRMTLCPLINPARDRSFGLVLATWHGQSSPESIVKQYSEATQNRILWQPKITIR